MAPLAAALADREPDRVAAGDPGLREISPPAVIEMMAFI